MQLFLLHFAGGNCYSYNFLIKKIRELLTTEIDIYALELPGRGKRYKETLITDKRKAIADYTCQLNEKRNEEPYIVYGHSMGALLGFSVVKNMEIQKDPPLCLIATGNPGPGFEKIDDELEYPYREKHLLKEWEFKRYLKKLGGIPEEILANDELFNFFSPIIRADFQLLEEEKYVDTGIVIDTPIHTLMGHAESNADQINNWEKYTTAAFKAQIISGNHFFIYEYPEVLVKTILYYFQQIQQKITSS